MNKSFLSGKTHRKSTESTVQYSILYGGWGYCVHLTRYYLVVRRSIVKVHLVTNVISDPGIVYHLLVQGGQFNMAVFFLVKSG